MKKYFWLASVVFLLISCKQSSHDYAKVFSDPVLYCKTVKKLNDVVLYNNFPPMIASRNYAYANIAAYECIVAGDSNYLSLAGQIKHMPHMPKPEAGKKIDFQLASLLSFVKVGNAVTFPEGVLMDYWQELKDKADSAGMPDDVLKNTVAFSDTMVSAIMAWSK